MASWLNRWHNSSGAANSANKNLGRDSFGRGAAAQNHAEKRTSGFSRQQSNLSEKDPNVPIERLLLHQKCLYERMLPGNAFISAHVNRLQHGYYENPALHEPTLDNVYFVSIHFVFHPHDHRAHRFKSAVIKVSVHDRDPAVIPEHPFHGPPVDYPRILKHAPELVYGAVSPENLQWNFSLSSSLGVSHTPVAATLNPSGSIKSSYKIFDMMTIQGSLRSRESQMGPEYDVIDGMAVWTLEENLLQRSGLPREYDFVMLLHKPDDANDIYLTVDVDAVIDSWFGNYPQWYTNLSKYLPSQDYTLDFDADVGQKFLPVHPTRGFNFAQLPHALEHYIHMPGTMYPTNDTTNSDGKKEWSHHRRNSLDQSYHSHKPLDTDMRMQQTQQLATPTSPTTLTPTKSSNQKPPSNRHSWIPETLNVRVTLEHAPPPPRAPTPKRYSTGSPVPHQDPSRQHSIRRRRSRTGLKELGAQQALQSSPPPQKHPWV